MATNYQSQLCQQNISENLDSGSSILAIFTDIKLVFGAVVAETKPHLMLQARRRLMCLFNRLNANLHKSGQSILYKS